MARGNRKRRSNPTPPPLLPGASLPEQDAAAAGGNREVVLALWKNASEHLRRGTHAKALRILQKAMDKLGGLESSPPLLLYAYSTALELTAAVSADRKIRARHFKLAIEASRRATEAAPDSAVLAHFYANLLLGASMDMHDDDAIAAYPSIIAECERGIQIKDPTDPALYYLGQMDSEHPIPTANDVLSDMRKLQQLASEDLQGMKIAEFQRQQHASADATASLAPSIARHCADETKGDLEQSYEVMNDSGKCKGQGSVPRDSADGETSGKIQTRLDSDDFGCNFSTTGAYPNGQEEETPAEETLEYQVKIKDALNLKQFAEQYRSTSTPFGFDNGTIPSDNVCIQDDGDNYDRRFLQDLCKSIGHISIAEEVHGSGLKSDVDDKNCLLNVLIQSLWPLRGFRDELLKTSQRHKHVGDPRVVSCVVCALCHIFIELGKVSKGKGEAVAPTSLRMALSTSSTETLFQMGHMNGASEVLEAILKCVHDSYTYHVECHAKSHENNLSGSSDCANNDCVAHNIFRADVFTGINCNDCGLESRQLKSTSFLHHIDTGSLQRAMRMFLDNTFDDLLKTVIMDDQRTCDSDVGGCGKSIHTNHTLSSSPHVFTVDWKRVLSDILAAIGTEIDITVIYPGTSTRSKHSLVSVACLYCNRYICFAADGEQWVLYDDQTAKVVGDWIQVLIMCEEKKILPLVLFFEAAN